MADSPADMPISASSRPSSRDSLPTGYDRPLACASSTGLPSTEADRSIETWSPSATGRCTPFSEANRSCSMASRSATSSGVTRVSSTVTDRVDRSGSSNLGRMSTSTVKVSSLPSSRLVISTSGWPRA